MFIIYNLNGIMIYRLFSNICSLFVSHSIQWVGVCAPDAGAVVVAILFHMTSETESVRYSQALTCVLSSFKQTNIDFSTPFRMNVYFSTHHIH